MTAAVIAPAATARRRRSNAPPPAFQSASATAGAISTPCGFVRTAALNSAPASHGRPNDAATSAPTAGSARNGSKYPSAAIINTAGFSQ